MINRDLNNLLSTFHDFDLVDIIQQDKIIRLTIESYWNEMIDKSNAIKKIVFQFENCEIIEYILHFHETESKHYDNRDLSKLRNADIYLNRFEENGQEVLLHCGGIQEKSDVIGALIKIRFYNDKFSIYDSNMNEINYMTYMQMYNDYQDFLNCN